MTKIILLLAFCLSVGNLFAQDANADKLRDGPISIFFPK